MMSVSITDEIQLIAFWLCFTRWVTVLFQLPIYDRVGIPSMVKVLSALLISYAFFPMLKGNIIADIQYVGIDHFWFLTAYQAIVGLVIGYLVKVIMALFQAAGTVMAQQMGFAAMQYFDPNTSSQVGPIEKLMYWVVVIMILTSGALLPMFSGVFQSFDSITITNMSKLGAIPAYYQEFFVNLFKSAILLASPLLFTNVLATSIMGIMARVVPQMNILMVSFVVNIGLGLFVLMTISNEFFAIAYKEYVELLGNWFQFVK